MKVAVILLGPLDIKKNNYTKHRSDSEWKEVNLKVLEGCDVYIHTDKEYIEAAKQYNPIKVITTEPTYWQKTKEYYLNKYSDTVNSILKHIPVGVHFMPNFERIVQWKRLDHVLKEVNFSKYDFIVKWRLDTFKFAPINMHPKGLRTTGFWSAENSKEWSNHLYDFEHISDTIGKQYGGLREYIIKENLNKKYVYSFLDFVYLASYDNFIKANLYPNVEKYIGKKEETFEYNQDIYDESDFSGKYKCAKVEWLDSKKKPFVHVFTSEMSWLLNCLQQNIVIKNIFAPFVN